MAPKAFSTTALLLWALQATQPVQAKLEAEETDTHLVLSNDRFHTEVDKSRGSVSSLVLDGQDLLGPRSGSTGQGPYLDCYCIPSGFWTPGRSAPEFELYSGTDSTGTDYGGIRMADTYLPTGQVLEQYWFLRDGETGLHTFSRVAYHNESTPFLRNLQELRVLFRPNTDMWTHLLSKKGNYAPLPNFDNQDEWPVVQDATWYLGDTPDDPYVEEFADYFTKYTFSDPFRDLDAYGLFADGSNTEDGSTFGAWMVMNTKDTYFGGPTHSDLTVDGIVYNYISSNHHGDQTPNITNGFDRTFGPSYYYFNKYPEGSDILELHADAAQFADPEWNAEFYDSIAEHVANYVPSSDRATWKLHVDLPKNAERALAVLSQNGVDFQDNVLDTKAYQYWGEVDAEGYATIPMVKAGTYRLTIYADNIFGYYVKDNVVVEPSGKNKHDKRHMTHARWREETEGKEIWRIGTPDRSCGEYLHGNAPDKEHPLEPEQYRIYWANWDYPTDFPDGVHFKVGESDEAKDWNYIHWSVFGGKANYKRPETYVGTGDVNNWTISFDLEQEQIHRKRQATFTVQLAGAKTAAGNTDIFNASEPQANLHYTVNVNGQDLEPWIIPWNQSSSCGVRSGAICYNVGHKFEFHPKLLKEGENELVLSLPYNATNYEPAKLAESVYVQYDALRFEIV
ncbi:family 4 polysaccharide lyase [Emericellopsis atlantica]|uniref:rhamnogalacturonan endolyase n=1 Tax=Emericellopsis atlantica TaxID=2614577 RepID=A0A9P8CMP9_9HYPO|nr:family 4 polysaccharide lyase [Emericellopsis atlantica]KAG9250921.1 family 4 polysaccharide lyase [Emericellopsis atlantica]